MSSALLESLNNWFSGGSSRTRFSPESVLKFTNLDPRVQTHLSRVYALLAAAAAVAALGSYAHISFGIHGVLTQIAAFACLISLGFMANNPGNQTKRVACLGGFAFCQGASIGPLVGYALAINPAVILIAFASTTAVFVSFSLSALITRRRAYMYLGGYLASATAALLVLRLGSFVFGHGAALYNLELYGGLLMFAAYILYDTQLIVERASAGEMDEVRHALDLLIDVFGLFVRILLILVKNQEKESERRRKEDNKRRN